MRLPDEAATEIRARRAAVSEAEIAGVVAGVLAEIQALQGWLTRYVILDADGVAAIGEAGHLGRHWTSDGSDMSLDALLVPDHADERWHFHEMTGRISGAEAVDWTATVLARLSIPWEREITLRRDAEIELGGVWVIDEQSRCRQERVRPDLIGHAFRAGATDLTGSTLTP